MLNQYNREEFEEQLVLAGLSSALSPIDLIREYQKLFIANENNEAHFRAENLTKKLEAAIIKGNELEIALRDTKKELSLARAKCDSQMLNDQIAHEKYKVLSANLLKYGAHKDNCGYIESLEIGKVNAKMTEKDCCDCGYVQIVENTMNNLEPTKEEPNSN